MTAIPVIPTRPLYDSTDSLLRFAMRADATLTGLLGLAIAFAADPLSRMTGLTSFQEYALGGVFVFYGLVVFSLAAPLNLRRVGTAVVVANLVSTILAAVAAAVLPLTAFGVAVTLATGAYTLVFAALQYLGVRRLPA
jgi:choline-glycine betaine transporter